MSAAVALLRSEWMKLRSLRSTYLMLGLAGALGLGVSLLSIRSTVHGWPRIPAADRAAFDSVAESLAGFEFAQLVLGALGALVATGEYTTGTVGPTLVATPHRLRVYLAKLTVLAAVTVPVCSGFALAAFLLGQGQLSAIDMDVSLGQPHVLRSVTCAGLYLVVVTLVGFGLGTIFRHPAVAICMVVALVFLAWPIARAVESYSYLPDRWLLVNAADALVGTAPPSPQNLPRTPSLSMACLELGAYLTVILGLGAWRACRDAW
jgi:ABC-2 type transport system permease protein